MPRTVLVTGCSSGIGLSTAVLLAEAGWHVVATLRDPGRGSALAERARSRGVSLDVRPLDVASPASIERCVGAVLRDLGGLDALVNNAGFGMLGSVEQVAPQSLARAMDTNFFGVWNTTRAVLPSMRERGAGRIVTVTSVGGLLGQPFNDAYCAAKFAVEGMMESLAPVARAFGVRVSLVEPGPVNTEFVRGTRERSQANLASDVPGYAELIAAYAASTQNVFAEHGQTGDEVGRILVEVLESPEPHLRYVTSDFAREMVQRKYVDPTGDSILEIFGSRLRPGG